MYEGRGMGGGLHEDVTERVVWICYCWRERMIYLYCMMAWDPLMGIQNVISFDEKCIYVGRHE